MTFRGALFASAVAVATLAGCDRSSAPAPPASTAPPPAASPAGPRVYVSDETGGRIVIIDPEARQVAQTIDVGKRPRGISLSPDGRQLYVALSGSPIAGPG